MIADLEEMKSVLLPKHHERIRKVLPKPPASSLFGVDEVTKQYELVKMIREQVLDAEGNFLAELEPRVLASLVSSINSLISLFLKNSEKLDKMREIEDTQIALTEIVSEFSKEDQVKFFTRLDQLAQRG
jgi:hypothetical protein